MIKYYYYLKRIKLFIIITKKRDKTIQPYPYIHVRIYGYAQG